MSCIFCQIVSGESEASRVYEDEEFLAFLDIYPIRPGHLLLIPRHHGQFVADYDESAMGRLFMLGTRLAKAMRRGQLCKDINFVLNDGPAANQTVAHVHLHLVPRTPRDTAMLAKKLLQRPVQPLLGREKRSTLDRQAKTIAIALELPDR